MRGDTLPSLMTFFALAACGGGSSTATPDAVATTDAQVTCEGACRSTRVTAAMSATRTLDQAIYGVTSSASGPTLHVEVHSGGGTGCPDASSPTPSYTLVLARVPIPSSTEPVTSPGNLLDFVGDLLGGDLGAVATDVTITPVAVTTPTEPGGTLALDIALTFAAGTVSGHLFAVHCASLDSQE